MMTKNLEFTNYYYDKSGKKYRLRLEKDIDEVTEHD